MLEVLDIPDVRNQIAPISIERYHRMIEMGLFDDWNVELLNGALVEKISKSSFHVFVVDLLLELLRAHCPETEFWVRKEDPLTIGDSEPEPDISVVAGSRRQYKHTNPITARFVIEVAISSVGIDRAKAGDYAAAGVPEYWIVRPEAKTTEVYRNPVDGEYTSKEEVPAASRLESSALPGFFFFLTDALKED
jgi:Uma2 family endonuclease